MSAARNLRTIIINRRDYPGSTKYSDSELEDLVKGRKVFLDRLALLLAYFLKHFVQKEKVPKISADGTRGGFSLLAWSMGTASAMRTSSTL